VLPRALPLALAVALALAACRPADPPPAPPPTPAPEAVAPDPSAVPEAPAPAAPEVVAEVRQHPLTVAEVERYARAAEAVHRAGDADPDARRIEQEFEDRLARAQSLEEVEALLDGNPRVRQALQDAGISSRDYALTGTALLGAYTYVLARDEGHPDAARPDYVTDAHVRFIEQNRAEVDRIVARLQSIYGVDFDELEDFDLP